MNYVGEWAWDLPHRMSEYPLERVVWKPPTDEAAEAVWMVLRPGYLVALFVAGWAIDVAVFGRFRIDYCTVLGVAKDEAPSPQRLGILAAAICIALGGFRYALLYYATPAGVLWGVLFSYVMAICGLFVWLPPPIARRVRWRVPLARALWRCVCPDASREVPFVEVLVADGLTSMAKVFFDLSLGTCVAMSAVADAPSGLLPGLPGGALFGLPEAAASNATRAAMSTPVRAGSLMRDSLKECARSPLPFLAWASPFLIRARQCVVTSRHAPDALARDLQRVNLLKYLTALPVIFFALCYALAGPSISWLVFGPEDFEALWALSAVINSIFSFMWDLVMDWGLLQPTDKPISTIGLRPVLLFRGITSFYYISILCNLLGRTVWSLRWSPQATVFLGTFYLASLQQGVEVTRRCLWNILRVEWECIKKNVHRADKHFPV